MSSGRRTRRGPGPAESKQEWARPLAQAQAPVSSASSHWLKQVQVQIQGYRTSPLWVGGSVKSHYEGGLWPFCSLASLPQLPQDPLPTHHAVQTYEHGLKIAFMEQFWSKNTPGLSPPRGLKFKAPFHRDAYGTAFQSQHHQRQTQELCKTQVWAEKCLKGSAKTGNRDCLLSPR